VRDLHFTFQRDHGRTFALEVDDLSIARGQHTAVIGPSGCGKTTLLRLIAGILTPRQGLVRLAGEALSSMSDPARRAFRVASVGMVFQDFALLDYLTALDNILLSYRINPSLRLDAAARDRARSLAEQTGIAHTLARKPARLSQGERQRVAICRALVTSPAVVLCDEPTGNLDPARSRSIVGLILRETNALGATALVVTHDRSLLDVFPRVIDAAEFAHAPASARAVPAGSDVP